MTSPRRHFSAARSEPGSNSRCSTVRNTARSRSNWNPRSLASPPITRRQPVSCHSRSKASAGPSWRVCYLCGLAALVGGQHHGAVGKARTGAQQPIEGAVLRQFVDPAERGDDRLARLAVDALVLDDLQIFGVPGALVAEEHGGPRFNHHVLYCYSCEIAT